MDPRLFPISCLFILFTILIHVPASVAVDDAQFTNCSQLLLCGNISGIGYPFWGGNRPESCGHPSFGLNCQGEAPLITIEATQYRILSITSASYTLTVAREDFWNDDCPQNLHNATLDIAHFNYGSNTEDLILYYGCRTTTSGVAISNQFACTRNSSTGTFGMYATAGLSNSINTSIECGSIVIAKVNQTAAQALTGTGNVTQVLNSGFGLQWNANNTDCKACAGSGGQCGSNTSTGSFVCYCPDQPYPLACNASTSRSGSTKGSSNLKLKLGIGFLFVGPTVILIVIFCRLDKRCTPLHDMAVALRKKGRVDDQKIEAFLRHYGSLAPKQYRYSDLYKMTNSFKDKLGQGGYGVVYKGKRPDGCLVAVKVLSEIKGNGEEFINEVASISRTSHVNVVTLLGFCFERNRRALIYEFVANGSLDKFIYSDESMYLELRTLFQIAVGTARGLEYLHRGCTTRIVHFDVKPQNILLDENFCPKISDFGLAKLCEKKESIISMIGTRGTIGYIAPEVFSRAFGDVSHKSDVYSYGMLILEMIGAREKVGSVSGTSEVYFPHWIYEQLEHGTDLRLRHLNTKEEEETARKILLVGLWCIQTNPSDRPPMTRVVEMLEGSLKSLGIPPKPYLSSPTRPDPSDRDTFESSPTVSHVVDMWGESVQSLRTFM